MGKQDVFKGALGWDDWIWWSGIGGLGLFLLMVILCCIVCVQRAKRKGRDEAMAVVQARERERQQQEQAQLRYAQAQQVRYPAREPSYKFSKPEQATYNPFGHDDHQMHRNSYAQPPVPRPKPRRGPQLPPPVVDETNGQQQQQQQTLYSIPRRNEEQQPSSSPPQELPQVVAYYGRTPQQNDVMPTQASPKMSQQYQRQQQVNPAQPPIMQYRRRSSTPYRSDVGSVQQDDALQQSSEVPFVQVNSPRNSNASTASTTYSVAAASTSTPLSSMMVYNHNNNSNQSRPIATSVANLYGRPSMTGGTLRDRIDALREGAPQDNAVRISMSSFSSGTPSTVPSPPSKTPPPPKYSSAAPAQPARVSQLMTATVLSDSSYGTDDGAFDEDAFGTARSAQMAQLVREDSEGSVGSGQFDDPETPPHDRRDRTGTGDSTGSIEF